MADQRKTINKRRPLHRKKLRAELHTKIAVLRIILQETLSVDFERAYNGMWPQEIARLNKSSAQVLNHLDDVLKALEKLEARKRKKMSTTPVRLRRG